MALTVSAREGENPLVAGLERLPVHPTSLVIFGATGDLAHRKLLPALYNLAHEGQLPERFEMVGVGRRDQQHADFRDAALDSIQTYSRRKPDAAVLEGLLEDMRYVQGSFDDDEVYAELKRTLEEFDSHAGQHLDRVFYLSTAPEFFPLIAAKLGEVGLNEVQDAEVRIVIEKPFGYDLASARKLNAQLLGVFQEPQIFRIDHYLGKETVQNLMALRFANALFEPVWNRNFIDHVQITAAEDIGIGGRAGYYEGSGALRDLVQNHMLQLLALLAMEPPTAFDADRLRDEKLKVLEAIVPPAVQDVPHMAVRAQYDTGVIGGSKVPAYRDEDGVADGSRTPTYAALRLHVSNWRWAGVPFYLRTGKRLARKLTEIAVILRPVPHIAFQSSGSVGIQANQIVFTLQPDEGVSVSIGAKIPGSRMRIRPVNMEFRYGTSFLSESPEAYERLILDAMRGDATLFTRNDEIEALWAIVDPILTAWEHDTRTPVPQYESGSAGPAEADDLLAPGTVWRRL
ncbi:MAG TPA: glucose-6-phosphate dehydrogenase [Solirubrobacteraceae bacterium]|nr:glucose-6-phosphate dehydrogenase [Solirubrobacteraceae bacterium]